MNLPRLPGSTGALGQCWNCFCGTCWLCLQSTRLKWSPDVSWFCFCVWWFVLCPPLFFVDDFQAIALSFKNSRHLSCTSSYENLQIFQLHHRWTSFRLHSQAFMLRLRQCTSKPSAAIAMWPNKACLSSVENARDWIPMNSFKFNKRKDSKMGNTGIARRSPSIFGNFWALPIPSS